MIHAWLKESAYTIFLQSNGVRETYYNVTLLNFFRACKMFWKTVKSQTVSLEKSSKINQRSSFCMTIISTFADEEILLFQKNFCRNFNSCTAAPDNEQIARHPLINWRIKRNCLQKFTCIYAIRHENNSSFLLTLTSFE